MPGILLLRLDAPLVSFGGPMVDNYGVVQAFPGLSLLTGLLSNALGYDHRETAKLQRLQERIRYAVRCDRPGAAVQDYQTVDLGQSYMSDDGAWTTRGQIERRAGASGEKTHIRYRDYLADSVHTVALALEPEDEAPSLSDLERAIPRPARPLFIGRKTCLPAGRLLHRRVDADSPLAALVAEPRLPRGRTGLEATQPLAAWWDDADLAGKGLSSRLVPVPDLRDWGNQVHVGRRFVRHGVIRPLEA